MWICINMQKICLPSVHSSDTVSFKIWYHDLPHPFLIKPTPKTFKLIFMKLYQYTEDKLIPLVHSIIESSDYNGHNNMLKMTVSSICSGEIVHLEILQCDWLRRFFLMDLCRNTANKNFQYKINTVKINDQIFL